MPDAAAVWDDREHPRRPGGTGGGQFTRKPGPGQPPPALTRTLTDAVRRGVVPGAPAAPPPPARPATGAVRQDAQLTQAESMSRDGWLTPDGSAIYQRDLRGGTAGRGWLEPGGAVYDLDHAIAKYTLTETAVAYRGLADNGLGVAPGKTIHDAGYTAVSASREKAGWFARWRVKGEWGCRKVGGKPVVVAITIPAGTHAMPGDLSVEELVLPRGGAYTVTGALPDGTLTARWDGSPAVAAAARRPAGPAPAPGAGPEPGVIERLAGAPGEITVTDTEGDGMGAGTAAGKRFDPAEHPRKGDGEFTRAPGGGHRRAWSPGPGDTHVEIEMAGTVGTSTGTFHRAKPAAVLDREPDQYGGHLWRVRSARGHDPLGQVRPAGRGWVGEAADEATGVTRQEYHGPDFMQAVAAVLGAPGYGYRWYRVTRGHPTAPRPRAAALTSTGGDGMGTGAFDPDTIAGLDRAGLDAALDDIAAAAKPNTDRNRGNAETLRRYWSVGEGAAKIRWGAPGDHMRCVRLLVEHAKFTEEQAHGYCQLLEKHVTGLYTSQHARLEKTGHAAAPATPEEHRLPALVTITGVDILAAGTWQLSTGRQTFTRADLEDAVQAAQCPAVGAPVIKIGHLDKRFAPAPGDDGEPAIGRVANMRLAAAGDKVIGDLAGMPGWLGAIAASAFPRRSIEGKYGVTCQIGHTHRFVVTALALLGLTPPGVGVLGGLDDIARLYGVTAAAGGGAWRTEPQDQEESVMAVTEEDVRRAYYATAGAPQTWWITELQMAPTQLVVSDQGTGKIYRVPFRIDGAQVAFAQPVEIASYADVAAGRGTGPVVAYASAAESRAVIDDGDGEGPGEGDVEAAGVSDKPWGGFTAADYTPEQWHRACLIHSHAGPPTGKGECKLPVREPDGTLNRGGVHAAAAALAGARGGVQASAEQKAKAAAALRGLYAKLGEPPPDSLQAAAAGGEQEGEDEEGGPDVEAAGDHGPHTGEHAHPHSAYGSQGGDATHEHTHRHNNDGVHDHAHDPVSSAGTPPDVAAAAPAGTCAHPGHGPAAGTHTHPHPAPAAPAAAAGDGDAADPETPADQVHEHPHDHNGDASHDHPHTAGQMMPGGGTGRSAPTKSAATAAASEHEGGSDVEFTAEQMAAIRQRLGKGPDDPVTPGDIAAAFQQAPPPPPVAAAAAGVAGAGPVDVPVIADGVHLVEGEILRDYQKRAVEGDRAVRAMHVAERDTILAGAIKEGKFAQSRLEHFRALWDRDPDGTRKLVASLAPNLVPVGRPVGSNGEYGADPDMPGDFEAQQAYRQLYPDDARGGISAAPGVRTGGY